MNYYGAHLLILSIGLSQTFFTKAIDDHEKVFTSIYNQAIWGRNDEGQGFSGGGSLLSNTTAYIDLLVNFMETHNIRSVVDAGCGDWEFSKSINWDGIEYTGYDVVKHVIEKDRRLYGQSNIHFVHANFINTDLPPADLLLCKHVLQHLRNEDILKFLPQLKKFKYCLITNEVYPITLSSLNNNIAIGGGHKIDLSKPPFNIPGTKLLHYRIENGVHQVFFIDNTIPDIKPNTEAHYDTKMYFCVGADKQNFHGLINLIGSIHKFNFDDIGEIAVFNLGLTKCQREEFNAIEKVNVYEVEKTNPDLLTLFKVKKDGTLARGWYAWKPVIIKQALDLFPYVLYLDSGVTVGMDLGPIFEHIRNKGYFLLGSGLPLGPTITKNVRTHFALDTQLKNILSLTSINSSIQGYTQDLYNDYVLPMYNLSKDLSLFADDGSAPNGFGGSRPDQSTASIFAYLLHLEMFNYPYKPTLEDHHSTTINIRTALRLTGNKINLDKMRQPIHHNTMYKICSETAIE